MATKPAAPLTEESFSTIPVPPVEDMESADFKLGRGSTPKAAEPDQPEDDPLKHLKPKEGEPPEGTPPEPGLGLPGDIEAPAPAPAPAPEPPPAPAPTPPE